MQLLRRSKAGFQRFGRAWRYLIGRMNEGDATDMRWEAQQVEGMYPLEIVSVTDVMERALERWHPHHALQNMAEQATSRVYNKWESNGDVADGAIDWAVDLIGDYAKYDNIVLVERESEKAEDDVQE